jgi:hypothetical protein
MCTLADIVVSKFKVDGRLFYHQLFMTIRRHWNWMRTIIEQKKVSSEPRSFKNRQSDGTITKY